MSVYMEKINAEKNCFRFYELRVEPDFFAESALIIHWGRIGLPGRTLIRGSGRAREVEGLADKIRRIRLKHGYADADPGPC
jgi:predicted DNA-binding WGR domain protein